MNRRLIASLLCAATVAAVSVTPAFAHSRPAAGQVTLNGVGSTADAPLFDVALNGAHYSYQGDSVLGNYDSVGSGGGQKSYTLACNSSQAGATAGAWDWGAWDVPQGTAGDNFCDQNSIIQIPVTIFGEAIVAHIPAAVQKAMLITGPILDKIYTAPAGSLKWGNPSIKAVNKKTLLPVKKKVHGKKKTVCDKACKAYKTIVNEPIVQVVRTDGSGTTFGFTSYLCSLHLQYATKLAQTDSQCPSKAPAWLASPYNYANGSGNAGVDRTVENTPGAIGYVETWYATQNGEAALALKNRAGKFVLPTAANILSDANNGTSANFNDVYPNFVISNAAGKSSYPISSYSWVGLYKNGADGNDPSQCAATKATFSWFVSPTGGQKYAAPNGYVPLSGKPATYAKNAVAQVSC